jgi:hypothetical protein
VYQKQAIDIASYSVDCCHIRARIEYSNPRALERPVEWLHARHVIAMLVCRVAWIGLPLVSRSISTFTQRPVLGAFISSDEVVIPCPPLAHVPSPLTLVPSACPAGCRPWLMTTV